MIEQILSYRTLFFNTVTTIGCAFLPAVNKNLHSTLITVCTGEGDILLLSPLLKHTTHHHTMPQFGPHKNSACVNEAALQWSNLPGYKSVPFTTRSTMYQIKTTTNRNTHTHKKKNHLCISFVFLFCLKKNIRSKEWK